MILLLRHDENWLPVVGYEGLYSVSNYGRVKSSKQIIKQAKNRGGYLFVGLYKGVRSFKGVHRLVLEAFVGPCPEGMEACHFPDSNKTNNQLANLRWGTRESNCEDKKLQGTNVEGKDVHTAKMTEDEVIEARMLHTGGNWTQRRLADKYGVAISTMNDLIHRRSWDHI